MLELVKTIEFEERPSTLPPMDLKLEVFSDGVNFFARLYAKDSYRIPPTFDPNTCSQSLSEIVVYDKELFAISEEIGFEDIKARSPEEVVQIVLNRLQSRFPDYGFH